MEMGRKEGLCGRKGRGKKRGKGFGTRNERGTDKVRVKIHTGAVGK